MKFKISKKSDVRIHNTLHNTAHHFKKRLDAHDSGEHPIEGSALEKLACLTFLAFSVEAHANFVGSERKIPDWSDRWSWKQKLKAVLKDAAPDWNKQPFVTICQLFELRDLLAHGRPASASISEEVETEAADANELKELVTVMVPWEELLENIDYKTAYGAVDEVWKLMLELHKINLVETLCGGKSVISRVEE